MKILNYLRRKLILDEIVALIRFGTEIGIVEMLNIVKIYHQSPLFER